MITEQEKDAALTVLADYIAQNDINMVGGAFENEVMGEFIVTYGKESSLQNMARDNAELVRALADISNMCIGEISMGYKLDAQYIGELIFKVTD